LANLSFTSAKKKMPIYDFLKDATPNFKIVSYFNIDQTNQILNIGDFCNECGNCNNFCPTNGAPYITKPKFYLTSESFIEENNCYYIGNNFIKYNDNMDIHKLEKIDQTFVYTSKIVKAKYNSNYELINLQVNGNINNLLLDKATEMIYLLECLNEFSIFAK
jgi:putative selenate reductase